MSHLSGLPEEHDEPRVVLERTIRLVEDELRGAPVDDVLARLRAELPDDLTARSRELSDRYAVWGQVPDTHFHCGFGHLEGYGSGYYTYMWSLVIAKDLFSAFDAGDLFAPEVATRYRDTVLAAGGSRDAADLVEEFLGRPYDNRAFTAWLES